jgi:hypothetical protein
MIYDSILLGLALLLAFQGVIEMADCLLAYNYLRSLWLQHGRNHLFRERRINLRVYTTIVAIAIHTYGYGGEHWEAMVDACQEYHRGARTTADLCTKASMKLGSAYGLVGVLAYGGDNLYVAAYSMMAFTRKLFAALTSYLAS